ncbi:MAG: biopolymer transporter ExbD [Deltaproteobacteria bacterium]|nr:biopolymer transporter ExbD [Deltaproteobacteria bacterium]
MRLRRKKSRARIEMMPLMDVVFLLLVFFIYSMLAMAVHRGMPLNLPVSGTAEREMESALALTVATDGTLFLDKEPIALDSLTDALRQKNAESANGEPVSLQIFAEDTLPYQELYRVLDAVKSAGIPKISLQARQDDTP